MGFLSEKNLNKFLAMRCAILVVLICSFPALAKTSTSASNNDVRILKDVQFRNPVCKSKINLNFSAESYNEITNKLPGKDAYNELIRIYHRQKWLEFDKQVATFQQVFPSSPLIEAVKFLELQAKFDRFPSNGKEENLNKLEREYRDLTILYPNSTLLPAFRGSLGDFWLKRNKFRKSLSVYADAFQRHSDYEMACVFLMGVAENEFLLGDHNSAIRHFTRIREECLNPRLTTGARVRLADIYSMQAGRPQANLYREIYNHRLKSFVRFYPNVYYQLAEIYYWEKKYERSEYYLNEYLLNPYRERACETNALKRKADILFQLDKPIKDVVGAYLKAGNHEPRSDMGIFAHIHALLIELNKVSRPERERRLKIFDEKITRILNEEVRRAAYLEKGLMALATGKREAVQYLVRMDEKGYVEVRESEKLMNFIRSRLFKILETEAKEARVVRGDRKRIGLTRKEQKVIKHLRESFSIWLKGTKYATRAQELYSQMVLDRLKSSKNPEYALGIIRRDYEEWFKGTSYDKASIELYESIHRERFREAIEGKNFELALKYLGEWGNDEFYSVEKLDAGAKARLAQALLNELKKSEDPKTLALQYLKSKDQLKPLIQGPLAYFWIAVSQTLGNQDRVEAQMAALPNGRSIASTKSEIPKSLQSEFWLIRARALASLNKVNASLRSYDSITDKKKLPIVYDEKVALLEKVKKYDEAFSIRLKKYRLMQRQTDSKSLRPLLVEMLSLGRKAKLWDRGNQLLQLGVELNLPNNELATFYSFAGRAEFEKNRCLSSIKKLEKALSMAPTDSWSAENRFHLGKCLNKSKRKGQAKRVWEELVKMADPFWSPLAKNELAILYPE